MYGIGLLKAHPIDCGDAPSYGQYPRGRIERPYKQIISPLSILDRVPRGNKPRFFIKEFSPETRTLMII
ncbi:Putative protein [Zobellia galactanivorans]|uniref:Uncharacterized protein n=1 Tax=Zobellia galactanivorans (strain DSM 12802 / CCUG 47099 / CIP 106680 / NCIMB 13871 / Dsij) TaxID=63186 RepID=G0L056_ZOBGA|nr:Putative protein [Zobellia galactanivorans]